MITMNFKTFSSTPKETLYPLTVTLPSPRQPLLHIISTDLPSHIDGTIQCMVFGDWLLPLSVFSRAIHVGAHIKASLLFNAEWYSIVWIYHILFIHSSGGWSFELYLCLGCMTNATNIHVQVFAYTCFHFSWIYT